jgi:hypothetical protein
MKTLTILALTLLAAAAADAQQTWTYTDANANFDGSITIAQPLAANGTQIATITALNFTGMDLEGFTTPYGLVMNGGLQGTPQIDFTMTKGAVTYWAINWSFDTPGTNTGNNVTVALSPTGDSFYSLVSGFGCQPPPGLPSPCQPISFSGSGGSWVDPPASAPEIDPASAAAGLTLLLGGLAVLRGSRQRL